MTEPMVVLPPTVEKRIQNLALPPDHLAKRCRDVVKAIEGDGSAIVTADNLGYDGVAELSHRISQEAAWDLKDLLRKGARGFDPAVFLAHRLALYYAAWFAWVSEAKGRDAARARKDRRGYAAASWRFPGELQAAVRAGRSLVEPIMKKRGNKLVRRQ